MKNKIKLNLLSELHLVFLLFTLFLFSFNAFAKSKMPDEKYTKLEFNIPMKDGILLATDVYLPKTGSKFPVVLVRTPYDKNGVKDAAEKFVKHNIVVVAQDCRGKLKSGGEFYPFINEREDGLATLRWLRKQEWCNGKVGGWGGSYVGITQWAISDSLDALTPNMTGASMYDLVYDQGLFALQTAFTWGLAISAKEMNEAFMKKIPKSFNILPLSSADDTVSYNVLFIDDWIAHEKYDQYWKTQDFSGMTKAPLLSVAGWYDIFLKQQIADFQILLHNGNPGNRLVIGPWCHGTQGFENKYGGSKKTGNQGEIIDNFLINQLADKSQKVMTNPFTDKKYNLFIMEKNEYFGSDTWPPKESVPTAFYLGKDNKISTKKSTEKGELNYVYNPADPYPSLGGTALGVGVGPAEQNKNRERKDQLFFETEILKTPLTLLGDLSAVLYVSSDARCTDFIVGIQDVFPDGKIINIQEGGSKVSFSGTQPEKKDISVWATGYEIREGHKLRVVITSSWFPRYNRSLNICEPAYIATKMKTANQTLWVGPEYPSCVVLPVLSEKKYNCLIEKKHHELY
ncbi:MAG TPA: CocE/NonD family hydrolase [Draconibacterium sp.]|nr:CocE/NonD family hydrolase [Draconibacterium sp.]